MISLILNPTTIEPCFLYTNLFTFLVQTIAESYKLLHLVSAEILACKVDQFLASLKSLDSTGSTYRLHVACNGDREGHRPC